MESFRACGRSSRVRCEIANRTEKSWIMGAVTIRVMNIESAFAGLFFGGARAEGGLLVGVVEMRIGGSQVRSRVATSRDRYSRCDTTEVTP